MQQWRFKGLIQMSLLGIEEQKDSIASVQEQMVPQVSLHKKASFDTGLLTPAEEQLLSPLLGLEKFSTLSGNKIKVSRGYNYRVELGLKSAMPGHLWRIVPLIAPPSLVHHSSLGAAMHVRCQLLSYSSHQPRFSILALFSHN
ncbi:hypothetical protein HAX54_050479 [Datura stramonium]|uniref:Uncharacterized protein n=1 Tax=Datura stramonium TaxID=4076 RepID=A0ABS8WQ97_DATST|nr:hypothetical protein [Datura stramonium]